MSVLAGAIGAGAVLAAIAHEASLAREADRLEMERRQGTADAYAAERFARQQRLQEMRGISRAGLDTQLMERGVVPSVQGRSARAVYLQEAARRQAYRGRYGWD